MRGSREHVYRRGFFSLVAEGSEAFKVAREGRGVAGDVDYPLRRHFCDYPRHLGTQSLSRRVNTHDVGSETAFHQLVGALFRVGADELGVLNAVMLRRSPCGRLFSSKQRSQRGAK